MTFSSIRQTWYSRLISASLITTFITTMVITPKASYAGVVGLPQPGAMVNLSPAYVPLMVTGLTIHPENPLLMDFIVSTGNSGLNANQVKVESDRLIKYFLACLTIPENNQWVNLSPYEKQRILPEDLGQTVLGQDMLAQDYILKQLTASLIYPEKNLGKNFWDKVYAKANKMYGTTQIPVNTFNKVWILPDTAKVYEHENTVFVVKSHLTVMLDEDYLALSKHSQPKDINNLGNQVIREVVLPAIETEVNTGKNFAQLRQIYNSMILAVWFKKNLKQALLNQVYTDKSKVNGVNADDLSIKEKIYKQYIQAYKKGVFNYIKEEINQSNQQVIPRKYFSGGITPESASNLAMATAAEARAAVKMSGGKFFRALVNLTQVLAKPHVARVYQALTGNQRMSVEDFIAAGYPRGRRIDIVLTKEAANERHDAVDGVVWNADFDGIGTDGRIRYYTTTSMPEGAANFLVPSAIKRIIVHPDAAMLASVEDRHRDVHVPALEARIRPIFNRIYPLIEKYWSDEQIKNRRIITVDIHQWGSFFKDVVSDAIKGIVKGYSKDSPRINSLSDLEPYRVQLGPKNFASVERFFNIHKEEEGFFQSFHLYLMARSSSEELESKINDLVDETNVSKSFLNLLEKGELQGAKPLTLEQFKELENGTIYKFYLRKAKEAILLGNYVPELLFAGKATRLNRGAMYFIDIWDLAKELGVALNPGDGEYEFGMGPRQLLAYRLLVAKIQEEIGAEMRITLQQALNNQRLKIHLNDEVEESALKDLQNQGYYGFNPENIYFSNQPEFSGYDLNVDGHVQLITNSPKLVYGHGDNVIQLDAVEETYQIDQDGNKKYLKGDSFLKLMGKRYVSSHRVNDLTKFSTDTVVDIEKFAMGMYLHEEKDEGIVVDLVANPEGNKGGTATTAGLLETLAAKGNKQLMDFINHEGDNQSPYNAFRLLYRADKLRSILQNHHLPYYLRFKDGYFYVEAVTGDLTQFPDVSTAYIQREEDVIKDLKTLKEVVSHGVAALRQQDKELREAGISRAGFATTRSAMVAMPAEFMKINQKTGTNGWRTSVDHDGDVLKGNFNLYTVGRMAYAWAEHLKGKLVPGEKVVVGFDNRPNSDVFALLFARVLKSQGIDVFWSTRATTSPAIIRMTNPGRSENIKYGFLVTASHNSPFDNGIKWYVNGVVMPDEEGIPVTSAVVNIASFPNVSLSTTFDLKEGEFKDQVDSLGISEQHYKDKFPGLAEAISSYRAKSHIWTIVDQMHGASGGVADYLRKLGLEVIEDRTHPMSEMWAREDFRNKRYNEPGKAQPVPFRPEPKEIFLHERFQLFKNEAPAGSLYFAIDGDADRLAVWIKLADGKIQEVAPNDLGVLYGWMLVNDVVKNHPAGEEKTTVYYIDKTQPTTSGMDFLVEYGNKLAQKAGKNIEFKLRITPVGSKYFAPEYENGTLLIGVEESGHIVIKDFFDDAVGQLHFLLKALSSSGQSLNETIFQAKKEIGGTVGVDLNSWIYQRVNPPMPPNFEEQFLKPIENGQPELVLNRLLEALGDRGKNLREVRMTTLSPTFEVGDVKLQGEYEALREAGKAPGLKSSEGMILSFKDGSWLMVRVSGTEGVVRVYAEASSKEEIVTLQKSVATAFGVDIKFDEAMKSGLDYTDDNDADINLPTNAAMSGANLSIDKLIGFIVHAISLEPGYSKTMTYNNEVIPIEVWQTGLRARFGESSQKFDVSFSFDRKSRSLDIKISDAAMRTVEVINWEIGTLRAERERLLDGGIRSKGDSERLTEISIKLDQLQEELSLVQQSHPSGDVDRAALTKSEEVEPGGIDFNSKNLKMESSGEKVNITFDPAQVAAFRRGDFSGVQFHIIDVEPINLMPLLGLGTEQEAIV